MDMYQKRKMRAEKKKNDDKESFSKTSINWYPGHMAKAKREIIESLNLIDVVVEVLDARIPISSQNPTIKDIAFNKKRLIILNKSDLANENDTLNWIKYFKNNGINAISVDSNTGKGIEKVIPVIEKIMEEDLRKYEDKGRKGRAIRILVLGIPNVGKSSFINRITKKTSMEVGNKPGVTKQKQWIRLKDNIELLDTPGILWPKFETEETALNLAYTGTIKDEILSKVEIAYRLLKYLLENNKNNIVDRYNLQENLIDEILNRDDEENIKIYDIMCLIGKKRGCLVSGGKIDDDKTANIILEDFRTGKIGKITLEKGMKDNG